MCLLQVNYYFYRVVYAFIIYIYLFIYCSLAVCVRCSSPVDANSLQFELCWNIAYIHTLKLWQSISECCKFVESSCIQICKHFLSHLSDSRMSSDRGTFFKSVFQPIANWFICPGFWPCIWEANKKLISAEMPLAAEHLHKSLGWAAPLVFAKWARNLILWQIKFV